MSKRGGDIDAVLLESTYSLIKEYCIRGGVATEVGSRAHNLHLQQGLFKCRYPRDPTHVKALTKFFKDAVIKPRKQYTIVLKPFGKGQIFSSMIGYIIKDQGKN